MRRVKDYNTFLNENLGDQQAVKSMKKILSGGDRNAKVKTADEIKSQFGEEGAVWADEWVWSDSKNGYVGKDPIFSGEVLLKEIDEDGDVTRYYEVLTGTNKGLSGTFSWEGGANKYPAYSDITGKSWSDVLGPDEEFLKSFKSVGHRWRTPFSGIEGIEIKKVKENGVCEIEYADIFQFYGIVRVYYSGSSGGSEWENTCYSYEVKDGPNKGLKGKGFQIMNSDYISGLSGVYKPFSNGDSTLSSIEFPAINPSDKGAFEDKVVSNTVNTGAGINPNQMIFFNTSSLSSIKGPTKEICEALYGIDKAYDSTKAYNTLKGKGQNIIFGKLERSKLSGSTIYGIQEKSIVMFPGKWFLELDGVETSECYVSHYQGNPLVLYTVKCQNKDKPSFDNKGVGVYGNNFFSGYIYESALNPTVHIRGEWYYDFKLKQVGILYAYKVSDKKPIGSIMNMTSVELEIKKIDFTDPRNKSGIVKDYTSLPQPMKLPDIDLKKFDWKNLSNPKK